MRGRVERAGLAIAVAVLLLGAEAAPARAEPPAGAEIAPTMRNILEALSVLLPASLASDGFDDPEQRERVVAAMAALEASGSQLETHGSGLDAGFAFLSRSLARDAHEIRARFEEGQTGEARFLVGEMTQACVACHSRLPDGGASDLGRLLTGRVEIATLPLDQRARLEVATRQFLRAADTYEAFLTSEDTSPADADLEGIVDDYLELCIRVLLDPGRTVAPLQQLGAREDAPPFVRRDVADWVAALDTLPPEAASSSSLAVARDLVQSAERQTERASARAALVSYLAASGVLHRMLEQSPPHRIDFAEAYYLLGVVESRVGRSFWIAQTDSYLEASIRLAPEAEFAPLAWTLLDEFVTSGYSGSGGTFVPPAERRRLAELWRLIESARATPVAASTHAY